MAKMKFGNGTGSVTKYSGKRRKPYVVRASAAYSIGKDGKLKENRKVIGCAATKEEAYKMLMDYLASPFNLDKSKITFKQLYEEWQPSYFQGISKSTQDNYKTAYSHCYAIYNRVFKDLRLEDYQRMFDEVVDSKGRPLSHDNLSRVKKFLGVLNKYALKNEIITKDYSQYVDLKRYKDRTGKTIDRTVFSDKEILKLWTKQNTVIGQIVLCLIYTGARVDKEFFNIKKKDVDLAEHCVHITASKTKNGIRWIPIPDQIYPIIRKWYDDGDSEYLFHTERGNRFDYREFLRSNWNPFMEEMGMDHRPYDCRHTYNSMLANLEVNTDIREVLMGHSSGKVNVETYTHYKKQTLLDVANRL